MMRIRFLIFSACLLLALPSWAESFFNALPDVPMMAGLAEIEDQAFSFDKPDGRIMVGVASIDDSLSFESVQSFYSQSLPQFGWRGVGPLSFVRGAESLEIALHEDDDQRILEITISP